MSAAHHAAAERMAVHGHWAALYSVRS